MLYRIMQYEIREVDYFVKADSKVEALDYFLNNSCRSGSSRFVCVAEDLGVPVDSELAEVGRINGELTVDGIIPGIGVIDEIEENPAS